MDHIEQEDPATLPASFTSTTELQLVAYSVVTFNIRLTVDGATIVLFVSTRVL